MYMEQVIIHTATKSDTPAEEVGTKIDDFNEKK